MSERRPPDTVSAAAAAEQVSSEEGVGVSRVACEPAVAVACVVCGSSERLLLCSAEELDAQEAYLREFHRRRLRSASEEQALIDRVQFTQDCPAALVTCRLCGLVYRSPQPRAELVTAAYAGDEYGPARLDSLFEAQRRLGRIKAQRLAPRLPAHATVLEVGSFVGGFLAAGTERGWRMLGVDPGEEVAAYCRQKGLHVWRGTLEQVDLAAGSVDCIAIWNTFDQLPDPRPTLSAVIRLLRPGGLLVIRVPNGLCYRQALRWRARLPRPLHPLLLGALAWNNLLAFPYLFGYGPNTLDRLLSSFTLERVAADPDTLLPLADARTRWWAHWEERLIKRLLQVVASVAPARAIHGSAPWLDMTYRLQPKRARPGRGR